MKKATIIIALALVVTGCGTKYKVDRSDLPAEYVTKVEGQLTDAKEQYASAENKEARIKAAFDVGFEYMILGDYKQSIKYFEVVLEDDPVHQPALINIASMYEEVGELDKALVYQQRVYEAYPTYFEGIRDIIRLLTQTGRIAEAEGVLSTFAKTEEGQANPQFVEGQKAIIDKAKSKL